jgi:hypothetical protein
MTDEAVVHQVIKETYSFWNWFWPALSGFLLLLFSFLGFWIPHRDTKRKEFEDQKAATLLNEEKKKAEYMKTDDFARYMEPFAATNEMAHAEVKKKLIEAVEEFGNTQLEVKGLAREVSTLNTGVEVLKSKVEDMPDKVTGMLIDKIYHVNPGEKKVS